MKKTLISLLLVSVILVCTVFPGNMMADGWNQSGSLWWYAIDSENYAANQWMNLDGWYYFDSDGYMQTGWCMIDGLWYYFGEDGRMKTGWQLIGNEWYYLEESGAMRTGWLQDGLDWYYLDSLGRMVSDTVVDVYKIGPDGRMTDWEPDDIQLVNAVNAPDKYDQTNRANITIQKIAPFTYIPGLLELNFQVEISWYPRYDSNWLAFEAECYDADGKQLERFVIYVNTCRVGEKIGWTWMVPVNTATIVFATEYP